MVLLGITLFVTIEAVDTIILEVSNHLTITAKAELVVTNRVGLCSLHGICHQTDYEQ